MIELFMVFQGAPRFDWTFNIGNILTIISILGGIAALWHRIKSSLDRIQQTLRDFPPHRHVNGSIVYPGERETEKIKVAGIT